MDVVEVTEQGDVFVITLKMGQNQFNPNFVGKVQKALDKVEQSKGLKSLVITAEDKFFSNGLDLEFLAGEEPDKVLEFFESIVKLQIRILLFPMITVAAVNGHAFGAGAFLALCCDFRIMNENKGFFCFPEVDLGLPLSENFRPIAVGKLPTNTVAKAVLTGKRFSGKEAKEYGIVDEVANEKELLPKAVKLAQSLAAKGANRQNMTALKKEVYDYVYKGLIAPKEKNATPSFKSKL